MTSRFHPAGFVLVLALATAAGAASAQQPARQPVQNPLGGLNQGPQGPLAIDADRLEVRDRERRAVFSGNVVATRGDAVVRAAVMTVHYDGGPTAEQGQAGQQGQRRPPPAAAGQDGQQSIRRIEMTGRVLFCQRDQTATGDQAVYERASELLIMTGNVVLTQGQNVVTGARLVVNLRTNEAQVERDPNQPQQRVRSILVPGEGQQQRPGQTAPQPQPARPAAPPPGCTPPPRS